MSLSKHRPLKIVPLDKSVLAAVKEFTDRTIGENYFTHEDLRDIHEKSMSGDTNCSFMLVDPSSPQALVLGVRLSYPPGKWSGDFDKNLSPQKWDVSLDQV